jgi:NAD(P)H-flavin reductase
VVLTLPIREVLPATPRARIARLDLNGHAFDFAAGQAVLVATHGLDDRRPYSIAVAPEDARRERYLELLVGIDPAGLPGPHLRLEPGELVDIEGPLGAFTFPVAPEEQRFVFIAGGTGIAPLRAMLRHALTIPHRNIGLFYSARTPDEFAYEQELRSLAIAGDIELRQTVTRASEADWTGSQPFARRRRARPRPGHLVLCLRTPCARRRDATLLAGLTSRERGSVGRHLQRRLHILDAWCPPHQLSMLGLRR